MPEEMTSTDQTAGGQVATAEVTGDDATSQNKENQDSWSRQIGNTTYTSQDRDRLAGDYENLHKEFTKRSQSWNDAKALETRLSELKGGSNQTAQTQDPQVEQFNKYMNDLGYVRKDEMLKEVEDKLNRELYARDAYNQIREFAGSTGNGDLPIKADPQKMIEFMTENSIRNPEHAYHIMYKDDIRKAIAEDALKAKPRTIHSERQAGTPRVTAPNRDPNSKDFLQQVWDDIQASRE